VACAELVNDNVKVSFLRVLEIGCCYFGHNAVTLVLAIVTGFKRMHSLFLPD
jgi:hypothetical protein